MDDERPQFRMLQADGVLYVAADDVVEACELYRRLAADSGHAHMEIVSEVFAEIFRRSFRGDYLSEVTKLAASEHND